MMFYECPHCGYIARKIEFESCPGCGCRAKREYVEVHGKDDSGHFTGKSVKASGYKGLFHLPPGEAPLSILQESMPAIPAILRLVERDLAVLIARWYETLAAGKQRTYDNEILNYAGVWVERGFGLLSPRLRGIIFQKIAEIVFRSFGSPAKKSLCSNCTYFLGEDSCDIADILLEFSVDREGGRGCRFFIEQVDLENLSRRLHHILNLA